MRGLRSRKPIGFRQWVVHHAMLNADNMAENLSASESRIRDLDMAEEMLDFSTGSILQQAGQSVLAQANQSRQGILSLLQ